MQAIDPELLSDAQFHPLVPAIDSEGQARKAGFEFELTGISVEDCLQVVTQCLGGAVEQQKALKYELKDTALGKIKTELDWHLGQKLCAGEINLPEPVQKLVSKLGKRLESEPQLIVPCELVTEPLSFDQLPLLERLRDALYQESAQGTGAGITHAYGTHINPTVPSFDSKTLCRYLKAYLLVEEELRKQLQVDATRRLLSYIDPFPQAYKELVLKPSYQPSLKELIVDYLRHNPTRNRSLDLLPLFRQLEPSCVLALASKQRDLIQARPTFHYRLPNCEVDNPNWRVAHVWNSWVAVERLANEPTLIDDLCRA